MAAVSRLHNLDFECIEIVCSQDPLVELKDGLFAMQRKCWKERRRMGCFVVGGKRREETVLTGGMKNSTISSILL